MKQYYKHLRLLSLFLCLLSFNRAAVQLYADASNLTNGGTASWGVGLLVNTQQFAVNGPYDAVSLSASDFFYDPTGGGTPIEIAGNTAPAFYDVAFANGAITTALISNSEIIVWMV